MIIEYFLKKGLMIHNFFQILWKIRCQILVAFPYHLKRSRVLFWLETSCKFFFGNIHFETIPSLKTQILQFEKKRLGFLIFLISRLLAPKWRENKVSVAKISKTIQKKGKSIKVLSFVFFVLIDDDMSKEMSTKIAPIAILLERSDNDFLYIRHKGYF